jgi:2'-5' RNA ligase
MKRLFVAIKIKANPEFLYNYEELIEGLKSQKINWISPDNLHLTMKFIGKVENERVSEIVNILKEISFNPYSVSIDKLGLFGSKYDPRVIWAKVNDEGETALLTEKVISSLENIGFVRDRQNFVPHLTLGRIKKVSDNKHFHNKFNAVKKIYFQEDKVEGFHLYQSILAKDKIVYQSIQYFPCTNEQL